MKEEQKKLHYFVIYLGKKQNGAWHNGRIGFAEELPALEERQIIEQIKKQNDLKNVLLNHVVVFETEERMLLFYESYKKHDIIEYESLPFTEKNEK